MEIKKLNFEKQEVQIKETYIDETGKTQERIKTVMMPTGNIIPAENYRPTSSEKSKNNQSSD